MVKKGLKQPYVIYEQPLTSQSQLQKNPVFNDSAGPLLGVLQDGCTNQIWGGGISIFQLIHIHESNFSDRCYDTFAFRMGASHLFL